MTDNKLYKKLDKKLPKEYVLSRKQHGRTFEYIAGYIAIEQANKIFGYDNWGYKVVEGPELHKEKQGTKKQWYYTCTVRSHVLNDGKTIVREDVGFKDVVFTKAGKPMLEVAYKGCVTDGLKRALRAWGNQFGNSLYDTEEKLANIQSKPSLQEEKEVSEYIQKIMDCENEESIDELLKTFNATALEEEWSKNQIEYIKNMAKRAKKVL